MPQRFHLISIRLDQETLHRLELLAAEYPGPKIDERANLHHRRCTRSAMIRHAINAGLDYLSHQPPLQL